MARWLSFFAEYNFTVEYKSGKQNVLADALSRRPDYELAHLTYLESPLYELIREAYADDDDLAGLVEALSAPNKAVELTARQRSRLHRYSVVEGLLYYQVDGGDEPRILVPNDEDLRHRVLYEAHDTPLSGHLGWEKTYTSVVRNFWWPHMYKWVRKYVQTCETCQRVKPAPSASASLMSLPVPTDCWRSVSMNFIFELPAVRGHTVILVFVCCLSKMVRLAAVRKSVTAPLAAQLFLDNVFRNHGLPEAFVSDRDPKFVSHFWQHLFRLLGTRHSSQSAPQSLQGTQPRVEDPPGQGMSQSGDAERPGPTPPPLRAPPPLLGNEGVLYYHVERLLKRRGRSGQYQYLVKWRGYPSSRNSWEPGARLEEDCADLVAAFERAHGPGRR
ncbi:hypothetical protein PF002_g25990 [Phytophthora fragariae]|uniref:Chromo domain-containing protein n=2 Tax=Phytophthora fragariae TaxID=53985 RepID=A0A6A3WNZ9_9STRA|nr:hypothetical protein PF002_g25990 [Phytophthora fragariae]